MKHFVLYFRVLHTEYPEFLRVCFELFPSVYAAVHLACQAPAAIREEAELEFHRPVMMSGRSKGLRHFPNPNFVGIPEQVRSEEHTSELQSQSNLVCRLLLE